MNIATMRNSSMLELRPPFEIRVGGTALWEAVVFEPIIISPSFFFSFQHPPHRGFYPFGKTCPKAGLQPSTESQASLTTDAHRPKLSGDIVQLDLLASSPIYDGYGGNCSTRP